MEQDLEAPCAVPVEVLRGFVAPLSVVNTLLTLSHLETRTVFLRALLQASIRPGACDSFRMLLEEFLEFSHVKVFSDPEVDPHLKIWNYFYVPLVSGLGL